MGQNNSTPSSEEYSQDIRFYTLFHFCEETNLDTAKIREIIHYKEIKQPGEAHVISVGIRSNPGPPEHEFLLAKVVDHSSQSTRWLRLDRSRQEKAKSPLNKSSSVFPANDTVCVANQAGSLLHPPSSRMSSLQYNYNAPSEPSLADLRCLLRLIHKMSPDYKLWQEQCYWFCNSIMVIMKEQFSAELVLEAEHNRRGKFKNIVRMPSNADSMTKIQTAFKSDLATNANLLRAPSKPSSQTPTQPPTQPHWADSESEVFLRSLPGSDPQVSPKDESMRMPNFCILQYVLFTASSGRESTAQEAASSSAAGDASLPTKDIHAAMVLVKDDQLPTDPEERDKYFMSQFEKGEKLCARGRSTL